MAGDLEVKVTVTGLRELRDALRELPQEMRKRALAQIMRRAVRPTLAHATALAEINRVSGATAMAMTIMQFRPRQRQRTTALRTRVGPNPLDGRARAQYALYYGLPRIPRRLNHFHFKEYGTRRQRATPYLRPALDATWRRVVDNIVPEWTDHVAKRIRRKMAVARPQVIR